MKFNEGKPKMHLVYTSFMESVARVRQFGIEKHGSSTGWKTTDVIDHIDAALRHITAYKSWLIGEAMGEENDPESGLDHLAHAACNLMFEIERKLEESKNEVAPRWGALLEKEIIPLGATPIEKGEEK